MDMTSLLVGRITALEGSELVELLESIISLITQSRSSSQIESFQN